MKRYLMFFLAIAMLGCGCATSVGAESTMDKELELLRQQNADLRRMVAMQRGETVAGIPGAPPPARVRRGPPQNWGWLHMPPQGCEYGPLSLEIQNGTDKYLQVLLDGEAVRIRGAQGEMPHLPPGASMYVCLSETGIHTLAGVAYTARYGTLTEVDRFSATKKFGSVITTALGRQRFWITDDVLRFN